MKKRLTGHLYDLSGGKPKEVRRNRRGSENKNEEELSVCFVL